MNGTDELKALYWIQKILETISFQSENFNSMLFHII